MDRAEAEQRADVRGRLWLAIPGYANPIPKQAEFVEGIDHKNENEINKDVKWSVVRAIQSTKMHSLSKLRDMMDSFPCVFSTHWPDMSPASGGRKALTHEQCVQLQLPDKEGGVNLKIGETT